jgi:hypothetical protein
VAAFRPSEEDLANLQPQSFHLCSSSRSESVKRLLHGRALSGPLTGAPRHPLPSGLSGSLIVTSCDVMIQIPDAPKS